MPHILSEQIQALIRAQGGWIGFDRFMAQALYAPGLGYYSGGGAPFGDGARNMGDFQTAPMMGVWLGRQIWQWSRPLWQGIEPRLLEFGAGRGDLARQLLKESAESHCPLAYEIVELSGVLREEQMKSTAGLGAVRWRDQLPQGFNGLVIANEVLDAMPVQCFEWQGPGQVLELGVSLAEPLGPEAWPAFEWQSRPARPDLLQAVNARAEAASARGLPWPPGYRGEWRPVAGAWIATLYQAMESGVVLLIDYGYPQRELDHPGRSRGTLCAHSGHRRLDDDRALLANVGQQDLTAHVDFSDIALAARQTGFKVAGFVTQAHFLINTGILSVAEQALQEEQSQGKRVRLMHAIQQLLSEAEMGEVFKVMLLAKNPPADQLENLVNHGFLTGSRLDSL